MIEPIFIVLALTSGLLLVFALLAFIADLFK